MRSKSISQLRGPKWPEILISNTQAKIIAIPCSDYKIYGVGRVATKFILIAHADTIKTC